MIVIGLTGSIGMGKTTAASMLKKMGCAVYDSDVVARRALEPRGDAFEEVALTFPECWDKKKHVIKRDVLAEIIFTDPVRKQILEDILHPLVVQGQYDFIRAQQRLGKKIVVLDIPLLFETNAQGRVDYTICVYAPYPIQRRRVLARAGMTEEKFRAILNTQMPNAQKCALADFTVPTGLGMAYTYATLRKILARIK